MKAEWKTLPFEQCIEKVKYTSKIASSEYLDEGCYPIVSQEEGLISGYWDNEKDVFRISRPVVIFGDHTRALKYVDFDFVLGADGVRILQPIKHIDTKFLLYYLWSCKIPSLGYSRHYKLLKELNVPVPSSSEQERIVAELDCLSSVIEKQKEQLKELDNLAQSIFYTMFGDPINNEKGWEVKKINELCSIFGRIGFRGYTTNDLVNNPKDGAITLSPSNIVNGHLDYTKCTYISWYKYEESPEIKIFNEDVLLVKTGSSYGKCALVRNLPHKATVNPQFVVLKDFKANNRYLTSCLQSAPVKSELDRFTIGAAIPTFSQKNLGNMQIANPPISLQQEFASKIEAIEKQKELIKKSIAETETLFNSRMDYYFN